MPGTTAYGGTAMARSDPAAMTRHIKAVHILTLWREAGRYGNDRAQGSAPESPGRTARNDAKKNF